MNLNSLADDLKDIPQAKLIQYVQDPNSVVPQFLALAEIQRRKNLERGAGATAPQTTVAQDIMAQAQPMMPPAGIAGLPPQAAPQGVPSLPSGMGQQSFAGGGIVAFAGDKGSKVEEDDYPIFNVSDALSSVGKWMGKNWEKNKAIREGRYIPENIEDESGRGIVTPAQATYSSAVPKSVSTDQYLPGTVPGGPTQAERDAFYEKKPAKPRAPVTAKEPSAPQTTEPKQDMYSRYEEMLKGQAAEAKAGREQDKWMRLLEAGLGIMGGTSPYAMTNIGQGAMGAAKGYAQDLAAQRKEERENVKDLMGLGLKREEAEREAKKLAIQEKYYGAVGAKDLAMADYYSGKGAGAGAAGTTKMEIAQLNAIKSTFATLQKDAANLGSPNYGKSPTELWNLATQMVTPNASGGNMAPVGPTVIPFSSLK